MNGHVDGDSHGDRSATEVMVSKVMVSSTMVMIDMPMGSSVNKKDRVSTTVATVTMSGSAMLMLARASKGTYLD